MDNDKLKVLKTEITSILASSSSPLTLNQFLREYKDVIGRHLPWPQYGYKNPIEFLKSMPEVLSFRNNEIGEILVPAENNSNHITKLVKEQKKNSKKGSVRRPRPVQLPRDNPKTDMKPVKRLEVQNPLALRGWERRQVHSVMNPIPPYTPSPQNFAYTSQKYSQFSQNLWNIDQLPQSLVVNTYSSLQTEFTSTKLPLIPKKVSINEVQNISKLAIPNGYCENSKQLCNSNMSNVMNDMVTMREDMESNAVQFENKSSPEIQKITEADSHSKVEISEICSSFAGFDGEEEDNCPISDQMKGNFRKILNKHKGGLLVSKLASTYLKMFNVPLNCQDYGFPTIKDLVMSCHNVFKIQQKKHAKDWLLFDVNNQSEDSTRWIPSQVLENMQELSLAHPKGIISEDILKVYKNMFKVDLDISKLGFDSLTSFLVNCQSIECCTDDDKYIVFPMKWGKKDDEPEESTSDPFLSVDTYSIFSKKNFQENVCDYQFQYEKCAIPTGKAIKVLVADCISPDCLWLQTIDAANSLNSLMFELNNFYDEEEEHYIMDPEVIHPGLACCVKFDNKQWHRGLINKVSEKSKKVVISYVDYGTISKVSFKDLRTLHKKFSEAAIYSFKSKLFNLKPVDNATWTEECLQFLYYLIFNKVFVAEIVEIKAEVAAVILVDTKEEDDYVTNFMLVENGFALHIIDPCDIGTSENFNASKEETSPILKKTEKTVPDCFLKLLPYWLHCGKNWSDVNKIFEKANHEFSNESNDNNMAAVHSYLTSKRCVQNKICDLFIKNPKVVCDAWNKTFYSLIDDFEKRFLKSIEAELLNNYNKVENNAGHINHSFFNGEKNSDLKVNFNEPKNSLVPSKCFEKISDCGHVQNMDQCEPPHEKLITEKEDCCSRNFNDIHSPRGASCPLEVNKQSRNPKIIPAQMFNTVIHLIRYDKEIYVMMDEILSKFAKGVPSMLVRHRLYQHQLNAVPFIVTSKHKFLYDELRRENINFTNNVVSLIPLSVSSNILLAVEPRNKHVADVLRNLTAEVYESEEFWST